MRKLDGKNRRIEEVHLPENDRYPHLLLGDVEGRDDTRAIFVLDLVNQVHEFPPCGVRHLWSDKFVDQVHGRLFFQKVAVGVAMLAVQ